MKHIDKKSGFELPNDWEHFKNYLINENRYVLKARWIRFLKALRKTATKRTRRISKKILLVRARVGSHYDEYEDGKGVLQIYFGPLPPKKLGAPPKEKAGHGRANPRGISYLYLSNKLETAIAEARPWIKTDVSVGYFQTKKNLKILDLSSDKPKLYIGDFDLITGKKSERKYTQEELETYIWGDINKAFSVPVQPGAEDKYYIPTQFIAEFFKNRGYQGIAYKSSVDESGHNIVLFNSKYAMLKGARVFDISNIKYEFKENGNSYSLKRTQTRKQKVSPKRATLRYVKYKVTRIIDGDTFEVSPNWKWNKQKGNIVRPRGYDAPEWGHPGYQEAKDRLSGLILGKEVKLKNPIKLTYDRLLCDVYYNGKRLSEYFK